MRILRDYQFAQVADRGASVAIGNFDGVHRGHQHVINLAKRPDAPLGVVTFEPHPREVFGVDAPPFRLMNATARRHRLEKLGVDLLAELAFDTQLLGMSAEEFVEGVLVKSLGICHAVVGADFRFGRGRRGDAEFIRKLGDQHGFDVTISDLLEGSAGEISSTAIRNALSDGQPEIAADMLGHWHRIEGPVLHGEKRGRELGYPTANMELEGLHVPKPGIYAVTIDVLNGEHAGSYGGVANLGFRPMFERETPNLESHLFDFKGDLYGAELSVGLVAYLREEQKFTSIDALVAQMDIDSATARKALAG